MQKTNYFKQNSQHSVPLLSLSAPRLSSPSMFMLKPNNNFIATSIANILYCPELSDPPLSAFTQPAAREGQESLSYTNLLIPISKNNLEIKILRISYEYSNKLYLIKIHVFQDKDE